LSASELEHMLSEPSPEARKVIGGMDGDIVVLGAGGKMGPTLAMMLQKAAGGATVYAVSRFTDKAAARRLETAGVRIVEADLLDRSCHAALPNAANVYYLVGMKFGASGNQPLTWAMNSYLPGMMAERYSDSRMVVLSTGNVYPYVDVATRVGEDTSVGPVGEYAQSCLGRERICEFFSRSNGTPMTLVRLNYANEPRYGILVDLTLKIMHDEAIDLTVPAVNLIWQRDANDYIARSITLAQSPPAVINLTGPETVMVRDAAIEIGRLLGREPRFAGAAGAKCLLSDASCCFAKFGAPGTSLQEMIPMIVSWVGAGKAVLNKPTKYEVSDGRF